MKCGTFGDLFFASLSSETIIALTYTLNTFPVLTTIIQARCHWSCAIISIYARWAIAAGVPNTAMTGHGAVSALAKATYSTDRILWADSWTEYFTKFPRVIFRAEAVPLRIRQFSRGADSVPATNSARGRRTKVLFSACWPSSSQSADALPPRAKVFHKSF